ncbi:thiamine-phosphate kinase [Megalodesulfovibrio paquesii]
MQGSAAATEPAGPVRSEDDFLALIDTHFPRAHGHVVLGRGDDCAILSMGEAICLSTDLFLEDVHFRRGYFSPADIGHKALAVNVSDIAAMGGQPLGFSLGLMVPPNLPRSFWDALFSGMAAHAAAQGVALTGGDLSGAPLLGFSLTIWGRPGPGLPLLRRGPVQPGDRLVVLGPSGQLGLARQGLRLLETFGRDALQDWPACTAAHLRPEPQVALGLTLAAIPGVHGCMDISDGLARDLPRLLAFGQEQTVSPTSSNSPMAPTAPMPLGARLQLEPACLHPELRAACAAAGLDPVQEAVQGGEDYALLAAVSPASLADLQAAIPGALEIGEVVEMPGVFCNDSKLSGSGFDHFSNA